MWFEKLNLLEGYAMHQKDLRTFKIHLSLVKGHK